MITVKLIGGLGNQMFQYAIGHHLAKKNNTKFAMDLSGYKQQNIKDTPRDYALGIFNVVENFLDDKEAKKYQLNKYQKKLKKIFNIKKGHFIENGPKFNPKILDAKDSDYLEGYWQSEKYFVASEDTIRKDFELRNPLPENVKELEKNISEVASASIHIRRGDYITNQNYQKHHGSCDLNYYAKAIDIIKGKVNNPHFFVFSDDIDWCKKNLKADKISYVSDGQLKDYEEMYLMSKCKNNIVANSSFSWWGAWLNNNPGKIIIAPKKWLNNPDIDTSDICPNSWLKI